MLRNGSGRMKRGVQVAQLGEGSEQVVVELAVGNDGNGGFQAPVQQPQPLDRVDRVHRPLERQVHVEPFDEVERRGDDLAHGVGGEPNLSGAASAGPPRSANAAVDWAVGS